jgi:penicillin-binding protein 1A
MAQAYATFANGGYAVKPYVIDAIIGPNNEMLYRAEPSVVCPKCEPGEEPPVVNPEPQFPVHFPDSDRVVGVDEQTIDGMPADVPLPGFDEPADRYDDGSISMQQMAELGEAFQPDATIAPELYEDVNLAERIISPQNAFLIQDAMRDVIRRGTGVRARVLGRTDLSGKTGTSNDRRDAWFAGFNSDIVGIVWVGYDDDSALGPREEGSRTALPIWIEFMRKAMKGVPNHQMDMPEGIVSVRISKATGCPASASHPFEDVMFEHFREDFVPECENDDALPDIFNTAEDDEELF